MTPAAQPIVAQRLLLRTTPNAPVRQDLQIPKPEPSAWMNAQTPTGWLQFQNAQLSIVEFESNRCVRAHRHRGFKRGDPGVQPGSQRSASGGKRESSAGHSVRNAVAGTRGIQ